jgi:hypothetical protein
MAEKSYPQFFKYLTLLFFLLFSLMKKVNKKIKNERQLQFFSHTKARAKPPKKL